MVGHLRFFAPFHVEPLHFTLPWMPGAFLHFKAHFFGGLPLQAQSPPKKWIYNLGENSTHPMSDLRFKIFRIKSKKSTFIKFWILVFQIPFNSTDFWCRCHFYLEQLEEDIPGIHCHAISLRHFLRFLLTRHPRLDSWHHRKNRPGRHKRRPTGPRKRAFDVLY